jgi:hypothetical protein
LFLVAKVNVRNSESFVVAFKYGDAYATRCKTMAVSVINDADYVVECPKLPELHFLEHTIPSVLVRIT